MSTTYNMAIVGNDALVATLNVEIKYGYATSVTATNGSKTVNLTKQGDDLPSGYTQLKYLESTGTQYIDTGVVPNSSTRMVAKEALLSKSGSSGWGSAGGNEAFITQIENEKFAVRVSSNYQITDTTIPYDNYIHEWDLAANGPLKFDEVQFGVGTCGDTATSGQTMYMFALHIGWGSGGADSFQSKRQYYCYIYSGSTLVRNFIPARRNSDDVLGMYDIVNDTFYTNAGTGTFVAGPEIPWSANLDSTGTWTVYATDGVRTVSQTVNVDKIGVYDISIAAPNVPLGYTQLEWISSYGAEIDTGYEPVSTCRIYGQMQSNRTSTSSEFYDDWFHADTGYSTGSNRKIILLELAYNGWGYYNGTGTQFPGVNWSISSLNTIYTFSTNNRSITIGGVTRTVNSGSAITSSFGKTLIISRYAKTWYFKITAPDATTLVRDMVPARRNSDDVVGMYDKVNNVFYSSVNSNVFTAGPEIN